MKVCTDSCLFGAWLASKIETKNLMAEKIFDIGSGTGLLSLMVAQKSNAEIDAVEINENSFLETQENFIQSPWNIRLQAFHADIKNMDHKTKYNLIISNPPFFENELKSQQSNKNIAKHDEGLTLDELLQSIKLHLAPEGVFAILLPYHRRDYFINLAKTFQFHVWDELLIRQSSRHSYFRGMFLLQSGWVKATSKELVIKDGDGNYTKDFVSLLQDYYLYL